MEINFSQELLDLESEFDQSLQDSETGEIVTLKKVAVRALLANYPDENLSPEDKDERGLFAREIRKAETLIVEVEQVCLLKKLIGKAFSPKVVTAAWDILEDR